ncbi:MAG: polymerase, sigma-24 subunit, subfamily [Candidatus Eremiobacteraeota bacterium]|nr:polymerase, sigma-24 subunit, subfamily [Candidatus Eremiobacteraeota bacterium]
MAARNPPDKANTSPPANVFSDVNDVSRLSALAEAAFNGDGGGHEALVRVLWPNAYRIAWSILGDRGAAEDTAQAACAAVCAKLPRLSDTRAFVAWAYRIIVSHARDQARARSRLQRREALGYDEAAVGSTRDDPSVRLDLEAAISRLPESLRLPLELHYFVGLTSGEVGTALGIPAATVRFRLMVARRRLRPLLCASTSSSATLEVPS